MFVCWFPVAMLFPQGGTPAFLLHKNSINFHKTFVWVSHIWNIKHTWVLEMLFTYYCIFFHFQDSGLNLNGCWFLLIFTFDGMTMKSRHNKPARCVTWWSILNFGKTTHVRHVKPVFQMFVTGFNREYYSCFFWQKTIVKRCRCNACHIERLCWKKYAVLCELF